MLYQTVANRRKAGMKTNEQWHDSYFSVATVTAKCLYFVIILEE